MKRLLATVDSGGSTNLFGGWEDGAKQLEKGQDSSISRVILLSDGQANHGLLEQDAEVFLQSGAQADDSEVAEIESLIQQRLDARKAKDWAAADAARDRLNEMGIVLEDGPQGTTWRRK